VVHLGLELMALSETQVTTGRPCLKTKYLLLQLLIIDRKRL
jgi:hypothetical protein